MKKWKRKYELACQQLQAQNALIQTLQQTTEESTLLWYLSFIPLSPHTLTVWHDVTWNSQFSICSKHSQCFYRHLSHIPSSIPPSLLPSLSCLFFCLPTQYMIFVPCVTNNTKKNCNRSVKNLVLGRTSVTKLATETVLLQRSMPHGCFLLECLFPFCSFLQLFLLLFLLLWNVQQCACQR